MAAIQTRRWCHAQAGHSVAGVKFGLFGININACAADVGGIAELAEESGWESVWTGEHYVLPDPPQTTFPSDTVMLDPFVALGMAAARTHELLLGTGVTVVPMHQPLALAKRVATVDRVSGGRFLLGVGAGYLEPEFQALGAPFDHRGDRTLEYLDAMIALWTEDNADFHGKFISFSGVRAEPRPVRLPAPPIHFGGHTPAALRRAVQRGQGWYGFDLDIEQTRSCVAQLAGAELEISVTPSPRVPINAENVARYAELGVTRLIVLPPSDPGKLRQFVRDLPNRSAV
jgi:probable F420-dependent oxidoreductase